MWPIPLFPTDANVVIADKRLQRFYTSHKFIIKQNAIQMLDVSILSYFRRPILNCGQREGSMNIWNNQNNQSQPKVWMKPLSLCFNSFLFIFRSFFNQLAQIVPIAWNPCFLKILIKERDENQLLKKISLLLQSSILVALSKTEQMERFFNSLPCPYFFPQ